MAEWRRPNRRAFALAGLRIVGILKARAAPLISLLVSRAPIGASCGGRTATPLLPLLWPARRIGLGPLASR